MGRTSWSLERVVAELRKVHAGGETVTYAALRANGHGDLASATERYAGSFSRALKLAGLDPSRPTWNAKRVIDEVRRMHREGVAMSCQQLVDNGHANLVSAATKHLGSWRKALAKAGVPTFKRGAWKSWEMIRDKLRELHVGGVRMTTTSMSENGLADLCDAAKITAGTWNKALAKAGIPVVAHHRTWTREEIIDEIRRLDSDGELGWGIAVAKGQRRLVKAAAQHFGSWRSACYVAVPGYTPPLKSWDVPRVLRRIKGRHRSRLSIRSTVVQREEPTLTAAARRLGLDWIAACQRAGVPASAFEPLAPGPRVRWNEELIVARLRAAAAEGVPLLVRSFPPGFVQAVARRFQSWSAAMNAAGVRLQYDYDYEAALDNRLGGVFVKRRRR